MPSLQAAPADSVLVIMGESPDDAALAAIERDAAPRATRLLAQAVRFEGLRGGAEAVARARETARAAGLDSALVPLGLKLGHFKGMFFDMDSTLATTETLDEMAAYFGIGEECARITRDAMTGKLKDYAASLRARVQLLAGKSAEVVEAVREKTELNPGAAEWIAAGRKAGLVTCIVSSGFTCLTEPMRAALGMTAVCSNVIEIEGGRFTGRVSGMDGGPILDADGKRAFVERTMAALRADARLAICHGDGSNDVRMISAAGLGVGFRPKPVLRPHCDAVLDAGGYEALFALFA
ncbi:MAG: phosphoserine phosphatase SerB [Duodenibacillus sp.]|nr:phosphoserine phosphatase SerB [Duodenibacillus sp.]